MKSEQKKNKIRLSGSDIAFYIIAYFFVGVTAIVCVLPFGRCLQDHLPEPGLDSAGL